MVGDNMEYLIGALSTAVFFILLFGAFTLGKKQTNHSLPPPKEELERAEKMRKDFNKLMNYDVTTALSRKRSDD